MRVRRHLSSDRQGSSVVELALIMPVFAAAVVGIIDLSRGYSTKLQLEQAAYRSIEKVQQYYTTKDTYSTLRDEAATAASVPSSNVSIDYWLECNGTRQSNYDTTCSGTQAYARWIAVDIQSSYTPIFNLGIFTGNYSSGAITLHGKAALRTQ